MDLDDWRKEIDLLDQKLLELLNRRAGCAIEIGRIKRVIGQPIFVPEREMSILNRILELNNGPMDDEAARRIFQQIIDESRRLAQENQEK
ncbi:MAG: chorismate mutase [Candidatus Latescibacteria bacterium]|nr:chorismate mutase [Candidatus Latescibacterota bacterium]